MCIKRVVIIMLVGRNALMLRYAIAENNLSDIEIRGG